ncbi:MAG: hemolysin family protein [Acidimicrobiales bacterium]
MTVLVAALLVLANGLFVAMEFSLLASLRSRIEEEAEQGKLRGTLALRSMGRLGTVLAGTQLGVTLASLALGSVAEPALDRTLRSLFDHVGLPESVAHYVALVLALAVVVFVHLVVGEMVPKSIALAQPERTLLALTVPASGFVWLFTPVIWVLNRLAFLGSRLFGVEPADELRSTASAAELGVMIEESREEGLIEDEDHELLVAALGFMDRSTADVMVPRAEIHAIPRSASVAEAEAAMRTSGHSRVLMTGRGLDDLLGFVHAKDLLRLPIEGRDRPVPLDSIRPMLTVSADRGLGDLLLAMRRARRHVAVVIDPDRVTLGMVTMEDVLEAIVGDIIDESDQD